MRFTAQSGVIHRPSGQPAMRRKRIRLAAAGLIATLLAVLFPAPMTLAAAGDITPYPLPTTNAGPYAIIAGPDGNVWFTEDNANQVAKVTPLGVVTEYPIPTANSRPEGIAAGPDGNLWFTESSGNKVAKITTAGVVTEYALPTGAGVPFAITVGPDGNLWFTEYNAGVVTKVTTSGVFTEYLIPSGGGPAGIAAGPDGKLWFTESTGNQVASVSTSGVFTEYPLPGANSAPYSIAAGPDGNLWFTEVNTLNIAKVTTSGIITEYPCCVSYGIAAGPDGNIWFSGSQTSSVDRIDLGGVTRTLSSIAVTPPNPTISTGSTRQFTAIGTYSDASTTDLTSSVTWASSSPSVATIGAATGLAQGVSPGTSTITATLGAVSGSTLLTVGAAKPVLVLTYTGSTSAPPGGAITLSATLKTSGGVGVARKNITFTLDGTTYRATTNRSGVATVLLILGTLVRKTVAPGTVGSYPIDVSFAGDATYAAASTSAVLTVRIGTKLAFTGATTARAGATITLSATLKTKAKVAIAGRTVTFTLNGVTVSASTNSSGVASVVATAPSNAGTYPITIAFAGDATYAATSTSATIKVR